MFWGGGGIGVMYVESLASYFAETFEFCLTCFVCGIEESQIDLLVSCLLDWMMDVVLSYLG